MNTHEPTIDSPDTDCSLPCHPLFRYSTGQASFGECIEAIDHVTGIIELFDFLELHDNRGGLSTNALHGFYWINVMTRSALSYASERLTVLNKQVAEDHWQESVCLSALATSLQMLDRDSSERLLDSAAARMKITRPALDNIVGEKASQ
jgi:hypothetical protein